MYIRFDGEFESHGKGSMYVCDAVPVFQLPSVCVCSEGYGEEFTGAPYQEEIASKHCTTQSTNVGRLIPMHTLCVQCSVCTRIYWVPNFPISMRT